MTTVTFVIRILAHAQKETRQLPKRLKKLRELLVHDRCSNTLSPGIVYPGWGQRGPDRRNPLAKRSLVEPCRVVNLHASPDLPALGDGERRRPRDHFLLTLAAGEPGVVYHRPLWTAAGARAMTIVQ